MLYSERFVQKILGRNLRAVSTINYSFSLREQMEADGMWPDWCALPMGVTATALLEQYGIDTFNAKAVSEMPLLTAAYIWERTKQVFRFTPELERVISGQPLGGEIPTEILKHMPVPCVYIELNSANNAAAVKSEWGFFAWLEWDTRKRWAELRLLFLSSDKQTFSLICPLKGTIKDSLALLSQSSTEMIRRLEERGTKDIGFSLARASKAVKVSDIATNSDAMDLICSALNLLLYICSEEPDYSKAPRRVSAKPRYTETPPRKANITNVGERISIMLRKAAETKQSEPTDDERTGKRHASPVPHIRRAHYHHFWTGPEGSADRKLVVKWIAPILVNANSDDFSTTVRVLKTQ